MKIALILMTLFILTSCSSYPLKLGYTEYCESGEGHNTDERKVVMQYDFKGTVSICGRGDND